MGSQYSEQWADAPLADIIPAYIYKQYQDDANVLAFAEGINAIAQGYLDWFNGTPLAVYTDPSISGQLLDFVGTNYYGIERPVISTLRTTKAGAWNSESFNAIPFDGFRYSQSGTATPADDDIYKRLLTWYTYRGDGVQMSVEWLRRRIARFVYGTNGSDIDVGLIANISITTNYAPPSGPWNTFSLNSMGFNFFVGSIRHQLTILVPDTLSGQIFVQLFSAGEIPLPGPLIYLIGVA